MSFVLLQGRGQQEWCEYKPSTIFLNTIYEIFDLKYFDYALNHVSFELVDFVQLFHKQRRQTNADYALLSESPPLWHLSI